MFKSSLYFYPCFKCTKNEKINDKFIENSCKLLAKVNNSFGAIFIVGDYENRDIAKSVRKKCDKYFQGALLISENYEKNIRHYSCFVVFGNNTEIINDKYVYYSCANIHVDYIRSTFDDNYKDLVANIIKKQEIFHGNKDKRASVCVFDLDDTLIDFEGNLKSSNIRDVIEYTGDIFDYVVLWTHGSTGHANRYIERYGFKFDLVISRNDLAPIICNKGIGLVLRELNRARDPSTGLNCNVTEFTFTCLVDDLKKNYCKDYTYFIKPNPTWFGDKLYSFYMKKLQEIKRKESNYSYLY